MEKQLTEKKQRRLERNAKIKDKYNSEVANGGMKSAVIAKLAKSYNMTVPTVYSIIR